MAKIRKLQHNNTIVDQPCYNDIPLKKWIHNGEVIWENGLLYNAIFKSQQYMRWLNMNENTIYGSNYITGTPRFTGKFWINQYGGMYASTDGINWIKHEIPTSQLNTSHFMPFIQGYCYVGSDKNADGYYNVHCIILDDFTCEIVEDRIIDYCEWNSPSKYFCNEVNSGAGEYSLYGYQCMHLDEDNKLEYDFMNVMCIYDPCEKDILYFDYFKVKIAGGKGSEINNLPYYSSAFNNRVGHNDKSQSKCEKLEYDYYLRDDVYRITYWGKLDIQYCKYLFYHNYAPWVHSYEAIANDFYYDNLDVTHENYLYYVDFVKNESAEDNGKILYFYKRKYITDNGFEIKRWGAENWNQEALDLPYLKTWSQFNFSDSYTKTLRDNYPQTADEFIGSDYLIRNTAAAYGDAHGYWIGQVGTGYTSNVIPDNSTRQKYSFIPVLAYDSASNTYIPNGERATLSTIGLNSSDCGADITVSAEKIVDKIAYADELGALHHVPIDDSLVVLVGGNHVYIENGADKVVLKDVSGTIQKENKRNIEFP